MVNLRDVTVSVTI